jgi:hypothetical protein
MSSTDVSIDLETSLVRGGNIDGHQISKIIDEVERNLVRQVALNPRQLLVPFHKLCLKLLDRLFGEDTTTGYGSTLQAPWIKGPPGGWLRRLISSSESRDSSLTSMHQTKLVECFSPRGNLMDLILTKNRTGNVGTSYEMKLAFFPQKVRMRLYNNPVYSCLKSDNHEVYFTLLQNPIQDQIQHINSKVKDQTVLLDPMEYFLICLIRYPLSGGPPVLVPISLNNASAGYDSKVPKVIGVEAWIKPYPYLRLLNEYFKALVPIGADVENDSKLLLSGDMTAMSQQKRLFLMMIADFWLDSSQVVRQNHRLLQQPYRGATRAAGNANKGIIQHLSPTDVVVLEGGFSVRSIASMQCVYLLLIHILSDKTIAQQFKASTNSTIENMVATPTHLSAGKFDTAIDRQSAFLISNTRAARDVSLRHPLAQDLRAVNSFLPTYFRILQQPLYDMLRAMLSRNDSNASDDAMFHMAIQIWLLFINPWKAPSGYKYGVYRSSGKYSSNEWRPYVAANLHFYTSLATILFQSLGRVDFSIHHADDQSKLNVLEKVMDGLTSDGLWEDIEYLTESFRAVYPRLMHSPLAAIDDTVLKSSNLFLDEIQQEGSKKVKRPVVSAAELNAMLGQHQLLYPDRSIDSLDDFGIVKVSAYGKDSATALIDSFALVIFRIEVRKPHAIEGSLAWRIFWNSSAFLASLFTTSNYELPESVGTEICRRCRHLMKQISFVFDIDVKHALNPIASGYLDINGYGKKYGGFRGDIRDRVSQKLTADGKTKFLAGEFRMDVYDVDWRSVDALDRPLASYEIHMLTRVLVRLSKDLNALYGLPKDQRMKIISWELLLRDAVLNWKQALTVLRSAARFNLRFLANMWYLGVFTVLITLSTVLVDLVSPLLLMIGSFVTALILSSIYASRS